jgi:PPE-repeat protein
VTAPIWMALPPEVHSALLSSGPGPGPLLAAAAAWSSLSTEYATSAEELTALLAAVQAGAWEGPSAEQYAAAHGPYLAWLLESAGKSTAASTLHQTAAGAYTTALATMPTLGELAANHATHAVLVATNFFGVNSIPIALNEVDYVRMWVQAAETMTAYQAVAGSALAAVPVTEPAPPIVTPSGEASAAAVQTTDEGPAGTSWQDQLAASLSDFTQNVLWPLGNELYPDGWPIPAVPFANALSAALMNIPGMTPTLATAMAWFVFHSLMLVWPAVQAIQLAIMLAPILLMVPAAAAVVAAGVAGAASAAGIALPVSVPLATPAPAPTATTPAPAPTMTAGAPAGAGGATASGVAPSPVTASSSGSVGGGPGVDFGPGASNGAGGMADSLYAVGLAGLSSSSSASNRARRKSHEPTPDDAEVPATAAESARERLRSRRRRGAEAKDHAYRYEYIGPDPAEPLQSSAAGAGPLGFAGAATKSGVAQPAGLIMLDSDRLSSGPSAPMLPSSWRNDPPNADV